jgi:hypothetical protein
MTALRCKPGDLAVVVGPGVQTPGLLNRFVIVEELAPDADFILDGLYYARDGVVSWVVRAASSEGTLPVLSGPGEVTSRKRRPIADSILRPIRPNDGEDESLSWARPRTDELALSDGGAHAA